MSFFPNMVVKKDICTCTYNQCLVWTVHSTCQLKTLPGVHTLTFCHIAQFFVVCLLKPNAPHTIMAIITSFCPGIMRVVYITLHTILALVAQPIQSPGLLILILSSNRSLTIDLVVSEGGFFCNYN